MEIVGIQQWTFTFSRIEGKMSRVEIKFYVMLCYVMFALMVDTAYHYNY